MSLKSVAFQHFRKDSAPWPRRRCSSRAHGRPRERAPGDGPMQAGRPRADHPDMRSRTLLTSVLTLNVGLVAATAGVAAVVARDRFDDAAAGRGVLLIALAVCGAVLLNSIVLRHLLAP